MFRLLAYFFALVASTALFSVQGLPSDAKKNPKDPYDDKFNVTWYENDYCGGKGSAHENNVKGSSGLYCITDTGFALCPSITNCPAPKAYKSIKFEQADPKKETTNPPYKFELYYVTGRYDSGQICPGKFATHTGYGCVTTPAYASDNTEIKLISAWSNCGPACEL